MAENPLKPLIPTLRLTPSQSRVRSRSPSRSPERKTHFYNNSDFDPLLSSLSPESTLKALSATDTVLSGEKAAQDILSQSIARVSPGDRALGIRAALATQKLKGWYIEVLSWKWPQKRDAALGKGFLAPNATGAASSPMTTKISTNDVEDEHDYLGYLPVKLVQAYEDRAEEIKDGMEDLDVDELKEHVLNAHIPYRSRPSSSNSTASTAFRPLSYIQLSDFATVITATILQALPLLSKLNALLYAWDARLIVLREIPQLREALNDARRWIDVAIERLKSGLLPEIDDDRFTFQSFLSARRQLEDAVSLAGSRMDRILDTLEGHHDSLPEAWVDEMEAIEAGFATWAVKAERKAVENQYICDSPSNGVDVTEQVGRSASNTPDAATSNIRSLAPENPKTDPVDSSRSDAKQTDKSGPSGFAEETEESMGTVDRKFHLEADNDNPGALSSDPMENVSPVVSPQKSVYSAVDMKSDLSSSPKSPVKTKPGPLNLGLRTNCDQRRESTVSMSSTGSGYMSYGSNPEIKDAVVATSESPRVVDSPGLSYESGLSPTKSKIDYTRPQSDLVQGPRPQYHRSMSLPLQRFMHDDATVPQVAEEDNETDGVSEVQQAALAPIEVFPKSEVCYVWKTISRKQVTNQCNSYEALMYGREVLILPLKLSLD